MMGKGILPALKALNSDESGQASAELIIVAAALVAVAAILVGQLMNTGKTGSAKINQSVSKAFDLIDGAGD
ncbi:MAG: hypothetical protein WC792_05520 [Candidatus Micrarchaeia archaeon]